MHSPAPFWRHGRAKKKNSWLNVWGRSNRSGASHLRVCSQGELKQKNGVFGHRPQRLWNFFHVWMHRSDACLLLSGLLDSGSLCPVCVGWVGLIYPSDLTDDPGRGHHEADLLYTRRGRYPPSSVGPSLFAVDCNPEKSHAFSFIRQHHRCHALQNLTFKVTFQ